MGKKQIKILTLTLILMLILSCELIKNDDVMDLTLDSSIILTYQVSSLLNSEDYINIKDATKELIEKDFKDINYDELNDSNCNYKTIYVLIGNGLTYASIQYNPDDNQWTVYHVRPAQDKHCMASAVILEHRFLVCDPTNIAIAKMNTIHEEYYDPTWDCEPRFELN